MYMIKDLQELAKFIHFDGEYLRLGHPADAGLRALRKAIADVLENVGEKAVEAALGVIEEAIREAGWLTVVIGEHRKDEPSFETAEKLRVRILGGIYEATDYELVNFLVGRGFDRNTARRISEDLASEKEGDLKYSTEDEIDALEYLTPAEKQELWAIAKRDFCNRADMDKAHCGCLRLETCTKLAVQAAEGIGKCLGAYAKERSRENSAALCAALWKADLQAFRLEYEQYISTPDVRELLDEMVVRNERPPS
jgi:hypothetical protein